jgi:hypothetical protein
VKKQIVGGQIIYGPYERGNALIFGLDNSYIGMVWRSEYQRQSRKSLAKGHYRSLDEHGNPDKRMQELLKLRASTLKRREYRAKDPSVKSHLRLARKLQLRIDKRSEKLLAGIDHLCGVLHQPPSRFELQEYLKMSSSTFSEVTKENGFDWLPKRKRGRADDCNNRSI